MRTLLTVFLSLLFVAVQAQIIPAAPQQGAIAIVGAKAHIGDGTAIEDAVVAFAGGKITYVGPRSGAPSLEGMTQIDGVGKDVYPGFIAMNSRLGLIEIDAVKATNDMQEIGYFNPNARALIAFNTDSEVIPTVRNMGVLVAQVAPAGSGLAGQSSAMQLDGWNWEDAAMSIDEGMHLHWPSAYRRSGWWAEPGGVKKNDDYVKDVDALKVYFDEAAAFAKTKGNVVDNPRFRSMIPVFEGKRTLYIHADNAREIEDAIRFAEEYKVKPVLVGASDAYLVKDLIKQKGITVVCSEVHSLPERSDDLVSQPFETPAILHKMGIPIVFSVNGGWEQRRLPVQAGHAVGFGLPYEEAIKALTLTPATLLGISDRIGSLQAGKDATLFLSEGDALDMRTAKLEHAFIEGRDIDLSSRQSQLATKYREKYKRG